MSVLTLKKQETKPASFPFFSDIPYYFPREERVRVLREQIEKGKKLIEALEKQGRELGYTFPPDELTEGDRKRLGYLRNLFIRTLARMKIANIQKFTDGLIDREKYITEGYTIENLFKLMAEIDKKFKEV